MSGAGRAARRLYGWTLSVGDVIGKLLAFLTLPATLIAGYVYFDEIRDYFSSADLTTEIQRATLRCNYVWRDAKAYQNYQRGDVGELGRLCRASPIAISFEFSVTNNDSIAREIKGLKITANVPPYGPLTLDEVQSVEHLIQHGVETNLRRDWRVEVLDPGATAIFEVLAFGSTAAVEQQEWERLAQLLDDEDPGLLDAVAEIELQARVSGYHLEATTILGCSIALDAEEFQQWLEKAPHNRVQVTNGCQ